MELKTFFLGSTYTFNRPSSYEIHSSWTSSSGSNIPSSYNYSSWSSGDSRTEESESELRNIVPSSSGKDLVKPEGPSFGSSGTGVDLETGVFSQTEISATEESVTQESFLVSEEILFVFVKLFVFCSGRGFW